MNNKINSRLCTKCKIKKSLSKFNKGHNKNGRSSHCKECDAKYYRLHQEEIRQKTKKYYQNHKEKRKEIRKIYYEFHKKQILKNAVIYRKNNKEKIKIMQEKFVLTPEGIYVTIKSNSKKRNLINTLTKKEFVNWYNSQEQKCIYCGRIEKEVVKDKNGKFRRLTIDRKDNNKGYELNNIVLSCQRCNYIKGDILLYNEMLKIGKIIDDIIKERE